MNNQPRKVIQIATLFDDRNPQLIALCDDGTMWKLDVQMQRDEWRTVKPIPQGGRP